MVLAVLVFLGGMLTILSPCILPVLPFVFARAERLQRRLTTGANSGSFVTVSVVRIRKMRVRMRHRRVPMAMRMLGLE
jgi:cytochrome c biogenesis protein CcdA